MTPEPPVDQLDRLVGTWTTETTHPVFPGLIIHGIAAIEWLEGRRFLILRSRTDHPSFPHSISVIGITDDTDHATEAAADSHLSMHYFDSRGVFRIYNASIDDTGWRLSRDSPGFSQRFLATFTADGNTIAGIWELCRDNVSWNKDLQITYRRYSSAAVQQEQHETIADPRKTTPAIPQRPVAIPRETLDSITRKIEG